MSSPILWGGNSTANNLQPNLSTGNLIAGYRTQANANSTLALLVTDMYQQYFTGSTAGQVVTLPVASTLAQLGQGYLIVNNSTQTISVQSSGGNVIQVMAAGTQLIVTSILLSGTGTASWSSIYSPLAQVLAGISPTIQKFTSSSGTYTTPSGVQYIRVRMVGAGGGGSGGGTTGATNGGTGGSTTFGTTLLSAVGGGGAVAGGAGNGGIAGTASLGTGPIGTALSGAVGGGLTNTIVLGTVQVMPGGGANSAFGGGGTSSNAVAGGNGTVNTGGGGGGGGNGQSANNNTGAGGGSGGYIDAIITSPSATYAYSVGAAGTAGGAGTNGSAGGTGGSGYIEVTEYYNNLAIGTTAAVTANFVIAGPTAGSASSPVARALVTADLPRAVGVNIGLTSSVVPSANAVIKFDTTVFDTNTGYSASTGLYTFPITGVYILCVNLQSNTLASAYYKINGTAQAYLVQTPANVEVSASAVISVTAGDTIGIYPDTGGTFVGVGSPRFANVLSIGLLH